MRRSLVVALALALAAPLFPADAPARPNTLTPAEAAAGWLLLFDGETTFGWKVEGSARVAGGALVLGGEGETLAEPSAGLSLFTGQFEYAWAGKAPPEWSPGGAFTPLPAGKGFRPHSFARVA